MEQELSCHLGISVSRSSSVLIQISADAHLGWQQMMIHTLASQPLTWETRIEFLVPGVRLAQFRSLREFEELNQ